jgi:molecular chaperone GrpE
LHFAESMSDEVRNWAIGFEMLLNQFKQVLNHHGVQEYHSVGKLFDPHFHEAMEMVESEEYPPGVVVEEFIRGYKVGERPIRVARVKVAKAPEVKLQINDQGK